MDTFRQLIYTRQARVAWSSASTSEEVNAKDKAPTFSAAWLLFFAPGMGSTFPFSISQRSATWLGVLEWRPPISRRRSTTG